MIHIEFFVSGIPKGQPRPRAFVRGGHAAVYDPGTAEGWKSQVAIGAREFLPKEPIAGPLRLALRFTIPRPKKHFKGTALRPEAPVWCERKPDVDNYTKAVMDALTSLRMWQDDAQIVALSVQKRWANGAPGCTITISEETES